MKQRLLILFLGSLLTGCWSWEPKELILKPTASFTMDKTTCEVGCIVTFTSTAQNATTQRWEINGVSASTETSFFRQFTAAGSYTIKLTATNRAGDSSTQQTVTINAPAAPVAKFAVSLNPTTGIAPCTATFTNQSTNTTGASYAWSFGPPNATSNQKDPTYQYTAGGTYPVTLTVTGPGGLSSVVSQTVTIVSPVPTALFTFSPANCAAPCTVTFNNQSSANATSYAWEFGYKNLTSNATNPVYTYPEAGTFTVKLTATGPGGSSSPYSLPVTVTAPTTLTYLNLPFATMVLVKGGSFQMGNTFNDAEGSSDEKPDHQVTVTNFYMGQYEVTQRQWQAIMGSNPAYFTGCDDCPVDQVSWDDVQTFITKLNQQYPGVLKYRLPTEAEWEYAAGGGASNRTRFGNGKDIANPAEINFDGRDFSGRPSYSVVGENPGKTVKVGSFKPNGLGLYDMSGNVYELCNDWYSSYSSSAVTNPTGPATGSSRALRGGSWGSYPQNCRVSDRFFITPTIRNASIGFRLVAQ